MIIVKLYNNEPMFREFRQLIRVKEPVIYFSFEKNRLINVLSGEISKIGLYWVITNNRFILRGLIRNFEIRPLSHS